MGAYPIAGVNGQYSHRPLYSDPLDQRGQGVHDSVLFPREWHAFKESDPAHDVIGRLQHISLPYQKPRATPQEALQILRNNREVMSRVWGIDMGYMNGGGRVYDYAAGKPRVVEKGEIGVRLFVEKSRRNLFNLWILGNGLHEFRGVPVEIRFEGRPQLEVGG